MACSHEAGSEDAKCGECGTAMEKLYREHFFPLHFCQILTPGTGFHSQLEIPKKFAKNSRVRLHPEVTLRAIMTLMGDKVFLSGGWEEFVRAYSLREGNILVFKYDGISVFDVLIFDGDSLCEKEAAYFVQICENAKPFVDHKRKRISAEADVDEPNDVQVHRATKKARKVVRKRKAPKMSKFSHLYFNHRRKKRAHFKSVSAKMTKTICQNTSVDGSNRNDEELHNTETDGNLVAETAPPCGNDVHWTFATEPSQDAAVIRGVGWISEDETPAKDQINKIIDVDASPPAGKDALEMARDQATESSFLVTMHPSAVQRRASVHIPAPWYKRHLSPEIRNVLLRVGDKTWLVRLYHQPNGAHGSITTGWERFACENCLEKQDVCLFDLTSQPGDTVILDVSIFRATPDTPEETETEDYSLTI